MADRVKPSIDYESYVARVNLKKSKELIWKDDVSYFWASIMKMKRRALRRKNLMSRSTLNGKIPSP